MIYKSCPYFTRIRCLPVVLTFLDYQQSNLNFFNLQRVIVHGDYLNIQRPQKKVQQWWPELLNDNPIQVKLMHIPFFTWFSPVGIMEISSTAINTCSVIEHVLSRVRQKENTFPKKAKENRRVSLHAKRGGHGTTLFFHHDPTYIFSISVCLHTP